MILSYDGLYDLNRLQIKDPFDPNRIMNYSNLFNFLYTFQLYDSIVKKNIIRISEIIKKLI